MSHRQGHRIHLRQVRKRVVCRLRLVATDIQESGHVVSTSRAATVGAVRSFSIQKHHDRGRTCESGWVAIHNTFGIAIYYIYHSRNPFIEPASTLVCSVVRSALLGPSRSKHMMIADGKERGTGCAGGSRYNIYFPCCITRQHEKPVNMYFYGERR